MIQKITPNMSMKSIQAIFDKAGDIKITKGEYKITTTIYISSDTTVTCESGVVFIKKCLPSMFMTKVGPNTVKYKGAHDICWTGGHVISDIKSSTQSNLFTLVHARNVSISDVVFERSMSPHCIEINACKNVEIVGCWFGVHNPLKPHKEAIQIDFANFAGLTYADKNAATYDGTHCYSIWINDCTFVNVGHAIGTHTCGHDERAHKEIRIFNNIYNGHGSDTSIFVKLLNMHDVGIVNNKISYAGIAIKLNAIKAETLPHGGTVKVSSPKRNSDVVIQDNIMEDCKKQIVEV